MAPFRHDVFRSVWIANIASNFGTIIQGVGAAWMMTLISDSADLVALVQAAAAAPIMLFSTLSGAIADNFNRRRVMLVGQGFMLAVSVMLVVTAWFGGLTPWLLLAFTFLLGCGTALNNPSWQASVGDMVPRADLPAAVLLNGLGFNITRSLGPAIGGVIVAFAGGVGAFVFNAFSYLPIMTVLMRWRPSIPESPLPREPLIIAIGAGLRYVAMSPNIGKVLLRAAISGGGSVAILALLPLVARDILQGGPLLYGVMLGFFGAGAVFAALFSSGIREKLSAEWSIRLCFIGFAICTTIIALSTTAWITCPALMIGGACWVLSTSFFNVTVQLSTPRWVLGRTLSLYQTAMFSGVALGSWIWGLFAEQHGTSDALLIASCWLVAGGALGFFPRLALPQQKELNLDPLNRWKEPHLALDVTPRSGPIVINIEYIIREEDTAEFLNVMLERRRIRRRDGARHWSLARDLEDPTLWYESYRTPTWMDYIRHNHRMTHADAVVGEHIRRLHAGTEPPRIHRTIERPVKWNEVVAPSSKGMVDLHH
ncbi:MFS transporter [Agaricicola taiwanensis]|uniref:MFS transporter n=1 Tax=Agaricicola taiwanensis TaxID=591372 RepID=A0A8J2VIT1_9RHOB|nr:MFS transporter [Agaricicola taiwanensis]